MSQGIKGSYLRVLSPLTTDGISPVVLNDRIQYREDHLPLTAKKMLDAKNEKLPTGLKKKIEVVSDDVRPQHVPQQQPVQNPAPQESDLTEETEDIELESAAPTESQKQTGKRGPKPKDSK